jgi:hypothetical protein
MQWVPHPFAQFAKGWALLDSLRRQQQSQSPEHASVAVVQRRDGRNAILCSAYSGKRTNLCHRPQMRVLGRGFGQGTALKLILH